MARLRAALAAVALLLLAAPGFVRAQPPAPVTAEQSAATQPPASAPLEMANCPPDRELCVQAERTGGIDLKSGVAHLEGNVHGIVRSRELMFSGDKLKAFRNGGQEWVRLVLEDNVRMRQAGRESDSDHGVLEREEIRLTGHVHIAQEHLTVDGHEAHIRSDTRRTEVHGLPEAPLIVRLEGTIVAPGGEGAVPVTTPAEPPETTLHALKAVLEDAPKRVLLSGDVLLVQTDQLLRIEAQQILLRFTPESKLESFQAEGNVVVVQPERRIAADLAQSRNELKTMLLVGHATLQQKGQFDIESDRMEVFMDARQGIMQSPDRQKPITLSLEMGGPHTYGLTQQHMLTLSERGLPAATLEKLGPLIGTPFSSRDGFRDALTGRLTRKEAQSYLETILAVTR